MLSHVVVAVVHLIIPVVGINRGLLIRSSMGGHLGCFQLVAVTDIVAVNILVGVCWMKRAFTWDIYAGVGCDTDVLPKYVTSSHPHQQ